MSHYSYQRSKLIGVDDPPFDALIMAALRKADTFNADKIRAAWPEIYSEMMGRYNAPGGYLPGEGETVSNEQGK